MPRLMRRCWHAICFLALVHWRLARSAVFEGELPSTPFFTEFIGKFCYGFCNAKTHPCDPSTNYIKEANASGVLSIKLTREGATSAGTAGSYFLMYDDEKGHWKNAWKRWRSATCEEKKDMASFVKPLDLDSEDAVTTYRIPVYEGLRPRFWYFAFVSCGAVYHGPVRYTVHATNVHQGWQAEFGVDHLGMVPLYSTFSCLFCIGTLCTLWFSRYSQDRRGDDGLENHPYCRLLLVAYASSSLSCLAMLAHYSKFMKDGFGSQRLRFFGVMSGIVASNTIFVIAILISKGWAISNFHLSNRRGFLTLIAGLGLLCAACELYGEITLDQSTKLYGYQSPGGVSAITLKIFMFTWFAWEIRSTYEDALQDKNRNFYKVFGIAFSLWFVTVPVTSVVAYEVDPWVRFRSITFIEVIAKFLGLALLSRLLLGPASPLTPMSSLSARQYHMDSHLDCLNEGWTEGQTT